MMRRRYPLQTNGQPCSSTCMKDWLYISNLILCRQSTAPLLQYYLCAISAGTSSSLKHGVPRKFDSSSARSLLQTSLLPMIIWGEGRIVLYQCNVALTHDSEFSLPKGKSICTVSRLLFLRHSTIVTPGAEIEIASTRRVRLAWPILFFCDPESWSLPCSNLGSALLPSYCFS